MRSVRYYIQPSPLGELVVAVTSDGLCLIHWDDHARAMETLARSFSGVRQVAPIAAIRSQIDGYLAGGRRSFELPLDLSLTSSFVRKVLIELKKVPFGQWTTYGALARAVHSHPRAVGGAVGRNPLPVVIPCHRVLAAGGSIGGFSGGLERKHFLLGLEGRLTQPLENDGVRSAL
jgi:methylated-DNA-[protein]-cysteine S-methyltransferase